MKRFTLLPRVILGLLLFVTGGGVSLATDVTVTNTVNGTTYTFTVGTNNTVTLSKIGDTDLKTYTGTSIDLAAAYPEGTFTENGTNYTITSMVAMGGNKTIKTVEMPSTVTSLPWHCFDGCTALTSFSIPGLKEIGNYAFQNCSALTGITIPEGATVGERAFQYCKGLKGVLIIPKGTYYNRVFDGCENVTDLFIHTGVYIKDRWNGHGCFGSMPSVTNVTLIDDGDHTIPAYLFGCASFKDGVTLTIPSDITGIGDYAFYSANFPTKLDLSSQFTSYGASAFEDNSAFKGNNGDGIIAVQKPKSATSDVKVDSKAFWSTGATEIDIYPDVDYSGCGPAPTDKYYATGDGPYNGTNINTIKFTDGITSVPDYLFLHASDIPATCAVTWPTKAITHIGNGAFCGVQFTAAIPKEMSGDGTIGEYAYAHNNMSGEITIPTGCINIGSNALHDCKNITKITVPSTTTSIGEFAFSGCAALASVKLPTLTSGDPWLTLGGGFIANDPSLKAFTITNAVKTIYSCSWGNRNDASFSALTTPFTVTLASDKVKAEIRTGGTFFTFEKDGTAENPNTLTIQVANGVTSIPDGLFSENESGNLRQSFIDKIVLSGTDVKSIGTKSFYHIRTLLSVDMSGAQNIASIGESAFADCAKLTTVKLGDASNITTVGTSAFSGCSALTSVDFGGAKKLQTLGESAFYNCTSLANINQTDGKNDLRGSTLTSIGRYTFGGCSSLTNLYLPSTLMRINAKAFVNSGGDAAGLVTKDAAYIETSAGHCFNTFCRGFDVNVSKDMNTTVNTSNTATVWAVTGINTSARQAILQQVTESAPSSESYLNGYIIYNNVNDSKSTTSGYNTSEDKLNLHLMFNDSHNVIENANSTTNDNMMKGVIDAKTFSDADEASRCYVIWGKDQKLHHIKLHTTLAAGKAYIDPGTGGNGAKLDGFSFFFSSEPFTPTAINVVKTNADSHSAAHDNDDSYYDLQGRKVEVPSTGIYIHHGRKVVITHQPQSLNL